MVGAIGGFVVELLWKFITAIFPSLAPANPVAVAQAEKDRADNSDAMLKAKVEGDAIEEKLSASVAADPSKLRERDKFERD